MIFSEMDFLFREEQEWSQPYWPRSERRSKSGCDLPCKTTEYTLHYTYDVEPWGLVRA